MWGILFYFGFAVIPATKDKVIKGEILKWNTRDEAENWARRNCGQIPYEAYEIRKQE